jgi:hypothetical protein
VRNTGSSALPASRLFAGGGFVAVPALAPGAAWESAPDTARQAPGNAAERLLATRAAPAALLLHVAPHHWRAIHAEPEP